MTKTKSKIFAMVGAVLLMAVALIFCGFTSASAAYAQEIEPCDHEYEETIVEATCTEMGYTIFKCKCGDSYKDNYTELKEHNYTLIVVEPTCTDRGYTTHLCMDCGYNRLRSPHRTQL